MKEKNQNKRKVEGDEFVQRTKTLEASDTSIQVLNVSIFNFILKVSSNYKKAKNYQRKRKSIIINNKTVENS